MDISVTEFKHRCLEIIRRVEKSGRPVAITRRGRVVARLQPPPATQAGAGLKPWEQLRALGGRLLAAPGESVLRDEDFADCPPLEARSGLVTGNLENQG